MSLGKIENAASYQYPHTGKSKPTTTHGSLSPVIVKSGVEGEKYFKPKHQCPTHIEALQLAEDAERMRIAAQAIGLIALESINRDRNKAWSDRASVLHAIEDWHRFARGKLQNDYLNTEAT